MDEEPEQKIPKFSPFTGSARRLDGKRSAQIVEPISSSALKQHQLNNGSGTKGSTKNSSTQRQSGTLVFGSNATDASNQKRKVYLNTYQIVLLAFETDSKNFNHLVNWK